MAATAVRQGALDFMEKPVNPQELLDRVHQALARDAERRQIRARHDAVGARLALLTSREREVVDLAVTGMTNKEIAARLGVSPQAIDARRVKAMAKLRVETVPELVRLMLEADAQ
jgi:two-component system response regulator FixJ